MTYSLSAWHTTMTSLAAAVARHHPAERTRCDLVTDLARQLAELWPLVSSYTDRGDGLRSPSLEGGSRSKGTHSDLPARLAVARADFVCYDDAPSVVRRTDGRNEVRERASLARVWSLCRDAEDALRRALSEVEPQEATR